MLGTVLATSYGDPLVIWTAALVLFTFPSAYLAWVTVQDRKDRKRRQDERSEERRLYEMVGTAFFGPDKAKWPQPGQPQSQSPPVAATLAAIHKQVTPSNGVTTAALVEQVRDALAQVEDYNRSVAAVAVTLAQHMSDNHGPAAFPL